MHAKSTGLLVAAALLMSCSLRVGCGSRASDSVPVATSGAPKSPDRALESEVQAQAKYIKNIVEQIRQNEWAIKDCKVEVDLRKRTNDRNVELVEQQCADLELEAAELHELLVRESHELDRLQESN